MGSAGGADIAAEVEDGTAGGEEDGLEEGVAGESGEDAVSDGLAVGGFGESDPDAFGVGPGPGGQWVGRG